MTIMSQREFADRLGKHRAHVTRLKAAGRLVMTESGYVDVEASEARIAATRGQRYDVEERFAAARNSSATTDTAAAPAPAQTPVPAPSPGATGQLVLDLRTTPDAALTVDAIGLRTRIAQMQTAEAHARAKERQDLLDAGAVIDRATVLADLRTAAGLILAAAETLPDRLAPVLVGRTDLATVRALLQDEIETFMGTIATQLHAVAAAPKTTP